MLSIPSRQKNVKTKSGGTVTETFQKLFMIIVFEDNGFEPIIQYSNKIVLTSYITQRNKDNQLRYVNNNCQDCFIQLPTIHFYYSFAAMEVIKYYKETDKCKTQCISSLLRNYGTL